MKKLSVFLLLAAALAGCSKPQTETVVVSQPTSPQAPVVPAPTPIAVAPAPTMPSPTPQTKPKPQATATTTTTTEATPEPLGNSTITNDSGRWLQVDVYDENGRAFDTLNLRSGDNQVMPPETRKVEIRVNGKSVAIDKGNTSIKINQNEDLEVVG